MLDSPEFIMTLFLSAFGYVFGSIPFGMLVSWAFGGPDPRKEGSGNIGATNVGRTSGRAAGIITLILDFTKGVVPTALALYIIKEPTGVSIVGYSAFIGHVFPIFLRFNGGKGVSTAAGVMVVVAPMALFYSACLLIVLALPTRYVSVGSISAAAALPFFTAVLPWYRDYVLIAVAIAVFVIYKHRDNIKRLRAGTEKRLGKKEPDKEPGTDKNDENSG